MDKDWDVIVAFSKANSKGTKVKFDNGPYEGMAVSDTPLEYLLYLEREKKYYPRHDAQLNILTSCIDSIQNKTYGQGHLKKD
jgi:uncharacterized protein (DUF3820 family)|tara:strand:- start:559 stop:804 length:246 start_codon:yes stop_codon:yes gene_type:complete